MRNIVCISVFLSIFVVSGCGNSPQGEDVTRGKSTLSEMEAQTEHESSNEKSQESKKTKEKTMEKSENYDIALAEKCTGATVTTNQGVFELELYGIDAPHAVANFCSLADKGFYDGVVFHRVIKGFMIQGGDPDGTGTGGPGYTIPDDISPHSNVRGTISMANTGAPRSGGSQFFINTADNVMLDHDKQPLSSKHPVFGKVVSGMDVIDTIEGTETGFQDKPVEDMVIKGIELRK